MVSIQVMAACFICVMVPASECFIIKICSLVLSKLDFVFVNDNVYLQNGCLFFTLLSY